jgi:hypothetical protein
MPASRSLLAPATWPSDPKEAGIVVVPAYFTSENAMNTLRLAGFAAVALATSASHITMAQEILPDRSVVDLSTAPALMAVAGNAVPAHIARLVPSPFNASAVDDTALHRIAGRQDTSQLSYSEQVAGVTKNSIGDNSVTGSTQISGNAFQNMSGLSILNVNSGNNVAINASMNVNVSFTGQP